jgi:hypothetical protein
MLGNITEGSLTIAAGRRLRALDLMLARAAGLKKLAIRCPRQVVRRAPCGLFFRVRGVVRPSCFDWSARGRSLIQLNVKLFCLTAFISDAASPC